MTANTCQSPLDLDAVSVDAAPQPAAHTLNTMTERQAAFLKVLFEERECDPMLRELCREAWKLGEMSKARASDVISQLLTFPRKGKAAAAETAAAPVEVPEGMHRVDGIIYKVQAAVHGSGHLYAKRLVVEVETCGGCENCDGEDACPVEPAVYFEYAPGAMRLLSEATKMSLEEAKEFGALYGTCCVCGRTLTDEDSIAAGIGPRCAARFGG